MSSSPTSVAEDTSKSLFQMAWMGAVAYVVIVILNSAYRIRMHAIEEYGPVIHEFDPYFNYRATEVSLWLGWNLLVIFWLCQYSHFVSFKSCHWYLPVS